MYKSAKALHFLEAALEEKIAFMHIQPACLKVGWLDGFLYEAAQNFELL